MFWQIFVFAEEKRQETLETKEERKEYGRRKVGRRRLQRQKKAAY